MKTSRWLCAALALVMVIAGPLAPLTATAQTPMPPSPPSPGAPGPIVSPPFEPPQGAKVGAAFLNVVYVPGKAILCGTGTIASTLLMLLTFGNAYRAAATLFAEGCSGPWTSRPTTWSAEHPLRTGPTDGGGLRLRRAVLGLFLLLLAGLAAGIWGSYREGFPPVASTE